MASDEGSFKLWIKQRRRALDLTQEDLSECVGCSTITVQKIEMGERRPSKQVAQRLAECLKIPDEERDEFVRFARGEPDAGEPSFGPAGRSTGGPPHAVPNNLPALLTPLIGREDTLAAACGYLLRQDIRLLTLTGVPGIGKTRLSLGVTAQLVPEFKDGVFFVELASIGEPELIASTIGATLGRKDTGRGSHLDWLKQFIRDRRMLLVLDNFEQVLDAAPVVLDLLEACPALKVLVTSREALHVIGEQQLPVPPLGLPALKRLHDAGDGQGNRALLHYPAVELFVQRAGAVDPGFALTEENSGVVAAICTRLEGLPLAIELAAARIRMLTPEDLLSHLDQRLKLLIGGPRHLPARLQTLRGAIDWSYRLLSPGEQDLFACLGAFVGGATLPAIEAVYSVRGDLLDVLEGVGSLVDKNLLRREVRESRFAMLEMVREYAVEKLLESGHAEAIKHAHALFFLQLAEEANMKVWGPEEQSSLDRLEEEHDNLRAALQWCLSRASPDDGRWTIDDGGKDTGSPPASAHTPSSIVHRPSSAAGTEMTLRLVGALGRFWEIRGYSSEGRERIAAVLSSPGANEPGVRGQRAWALLQVAALAFWQSDYPAVRLALEEALAIFQELGDKTGIARTLIDLSDVTRTQGDYDAATLLCDQALSICREVGDTHGAALALALLGWAEMRPGYYSQAVTHLKEALALARQLRNPNRVALALSGLGETLARQGEYERGTALLEESLTIRRATGYRWGIAATVGTLGWAAFRQGDLERASEMLAESLALRKELGDKGGVAWCVERIADIETAESRPLRAACLLGAAGALRQATNTEVDIADQADAEQTLHALRGRLGEQVFADAYAQGEAMTFEQVVAYVEAALEAPEERG